VFDLSGLRDDEEVPSSDLDLSGHREAEECGTKNDQSKKSVTLDLRDLRSSAASLRTSIDSTAIDVLQSSKSDQSDYFTPSIVEPQPSSVQQKQPINLAEEHRKSQIPSTAAVGAKHAPTSQRSPTIIREQKPVLDLGEERNKSIALMFKSQEAPQPGKPREDSTATSVAAAASTSIKTESQKQPVLDLGEERKKSIGLKLKYQGSPQPCETREANSAKSVAAAASTSIKTESQKKPVLDLGDERKKSIALKMKSQDSPQPFQPQEVNTATSVTAAASAVVKAESQKHEAQKTGLKCSKKQGVQWNDGVMKARASSGSSDDRTLKSNALDTAPQPQHLQQPQQQQQQQQHGHQASESAISDISSASPKSRSFSGGHENEYKQRASRAWGILAEQALEDTHEDEEVEGPSAKGPYYSHQVWSYYRNSGAWSDGICAGLQKPSLACMVCFPPLWLYRIFTTVKRTAPLDFRLCCCHVELPASRACLFTLVVCALLLCAGSGVVVWAALLVAVGRKYNVSQVQSKPLLFLLKSSLCPCMMSVRVGLHVDRAQGFCKPHRFMDHFIELSEAVHHRITMWQETGPKEQERRCGSAEQWEPAATGSTLNELAQYDRDVEAHKARKSQPLLVV